MAELLYFRGATSLPIPVERVLDAAKTCQAVLVLGWDASEALYAAASLEDVGTLLWWIEQFKHKLLAGDYA